jgi:hypothetical protein
LRDSVPERARGSYARAQDRSAVARCRRHHWLRELARSQRTMRISTSSAMVGQGGGPYAGA